MNQLVSRVLVTVVALPIVLYLVWLGGWWIFALALVAALIALHELYVMARELRPLVLAGYAGAIATLLGAQLGGPVWMTGGFMLTLFLAFVLYGVAATRQTATITISSTVTGVAWIALGLSHLLLIRALPEHGRLAVFTVLIAVFADDTAAYGVGRLVGRHKLAPTLSPGKTWEGFLAGTAVAIAVAFFALYDQDFLTIPAVARARGRDRRRRRRRRPLRVGAEARPPGEGLRQAPRRPRRHARSDRREPLRSGRGVLRHPRVRDLVPLRLLAFAIVVLMLAGCRGDDEPEPPARHPLPAGRVPRRLRDLLDRLRPLRRATIRGGRGDARGGGRRRREGGGQHLAAERRARPPRLPRRDRGPRASAARQRSPLTVRRCPVH